MRLEDLILIWIGAIVSNVTVSYVFKKTFIYRYVERLIIGSATGYSLLITMQSISRSGIEPIMAGNYALIIAFILGILLWTRLTRTYGWVSRYPTAIMIGVGMGLMISKTIPGQVLGLATSTITDVSNAGQDFSSIFNAVVLFVGVVTSLTVFIYTKEREGIWGWITKIGILYIYVLFGISFSGQYLASGMERTIIAFEYMIKAPLRTLGIYI